MSIMPGMGPQSAADVVVTVTGILDSGNLMVVDSFANELEVSAANRVKGTGEPRPGERWILTRRLGVWTFAAMLGVIEPPIITGDRNGLHPIIEQMLDALVAHGLLRDGTDPADSEVNGGEIVLDGDNDPYVPDPDDPEQEEPPDPTGPEVPQPDHDEDDDEPIPHNPRYATFNVVTYNLRHDVGPRRSSIDVRRLMGMASVINLQECATAERGATLADIVDDSPWNMYRPALGSECPILWDSDVFEHINDGRVMLSTSDGVGSARPRRTANWIRLRHRKSGEVFTFVNTHMENGAATAAFFNPRTRPTSPRHIERFREQMIAIKPLLREQAQKANVVLSGDFNVDFRDDLRLRNDGMPYTEFRGLGYRSNWDALGFLGQQGTFSNHATVFDGQYFNPRIRGRVEVVRHRVIHGTYSDHHPLLVAYRVRRSTR